MSNIYLVRHWESMANAGFRTKSPESIGLTSLWLQQAKMIVDKITTPPDIIIISSFSRTYETAYPSIVHFKPKLIMKLATQEFTFLGNECYRYTTTQERKKPVADYWGRCDIDYIDSTGAESFRDFYYRVKKFISKIRTLIRIHQNIYIFWHKKFFCMMIMILDEKPRLSKKFMAQFHLYSKDFCFDNAEVRQIHLC